MEEKKSLKRNDVDAYKISFASSNNIGQVVIEWDGFAQHTGGQQFVRAADSIAANISEGFGRYCKKKKSNFILLHREHCMKPLTGTKKQKCASC